MFVVVIGTALAGVRPYLHGERRVCCAAQTVCETRETHLRILDFGFGCGSTALGGLG